MTIPSKLFSLLFHTEGRTEAIHWLSNIASSPPIPGQAPVPSIRSLQGIFQFFMEKLHHLSASERTQAVFDQFNPYPWIKRLIPDSLWEWLAENFASEIDSGTEWLDHAKDGVQEIPIIGEIIEAFAHIPLNSGILSGLTSFAFNLSTGTGTLSLLEESKKAHETLPDGFIESVDKTHWKVLSEYLHSVNRELNHFAKEHPKKNTEADANSSPTHPA